MNYSEVFFGKSLNNLTWTDIENFFIDPKEETDQIEFKSFVAAHGNYDQKLEGIYKGVSAFLNSNGGILIWGSPEGILPTGKKEKIFSGPLSPIDRVLEKDSLIRKISSKITPMPNSINVKIIENGGRCVCVFEIQKSEYAPHQQNNTYYMRIDGQSVPAPHHYIEALFKQIKYPNLEGYLKFGQGKVEGGSLYSLPIEIFIFNESPLQNETYPFFRLVTAHGQFYRAAHVIAGIEGWYRMSGHELVRENYLDVLSFGAPYAHSDIILYRPNEPKFVAAGYVDTLLLSFGGKGSPLKSSTYEIDIKKILGGDPNAALIKIEENKLFADKQPGKSKEEKLKILIGR